MEETTVDIAIGAQYSTYTYWLLQDYVQWATLAVAAQVIFALRFLWQWIVSERRKESMVPVGFWYLSLAGGAMLTTYAFFRDPVLLLSQGIGVAIYVRNLTMIRQAKSKSLWYASLAAGLAVTIYGFCRRESWESWSRL